MSIPRATVSVLSVPGAPADGTDLLCLFAPVKDNADHKPRLYSGTSVMEAEHGFGEHIEYAGLHFANARKPILLCPLPIASPGVVSREDTTGNTGMSVTTVVEGADGVLVEHDGVVSVAAGGGGTVGVDEIYLNVSLDGGLSTKRVRLGTANTLAFDQGVTMNFAAGTLVAGDVIHRWHGSAPASDDTAWGLAFEELKKELYLFRSIVLLGDVQPAAATQLLTRINAYATEVDRYVYGRVNAYDRLPLATLSQTSSRTPVGVALTFDDTADTLTRATGSWLAEGYRVGDYITVDGSGSNDGEYLITALTATEITAPAASFADEVTSAASVTGKPGLQFDAATDTITRSQGSWVDDGFRADATTTVTGTAGNNVALNAVSVTDSTLTLADGLADEDLSIDGVSVTQGETVAAWSNRVVSDFAGIDAERAIDIAKGRYPNASPVTGWFRRTQAMWFASVREYSLPEHVATWRKNDGPVAVDVSRNPAFVEEYDDRVYELGNTNRFTTLRTWANGPRGVFISTSRTRGTVGTQLSQTHQVAVFHKALTIVQNVTETFIGRNVELDEDFHAVPGERSQLEGEVNNALQNALLVDVQGEGAQCSSVTWTMSADDNLNTPEAIVTGYFEIVFNGTIFGVETTARAA